MLRNVLGEKWRICFIPTRWGFFFSSRKFWDSGDNDFWQPCIRWFLVVCSFFIARFRIKDDVIHALCCHVFLYYYWNINMLSFFRKLSIGGKIKDGILPEGIMGTAEDLLTAKSQNDLTLMTDTELKESVYGKLLRSICVLYHTSFRSVLSDIRKMVRHCKWLVVLLSFFSTFYWNSRISLEIYLNY